MTQQPDMDQDDEPDTRAGDDADVEPIELADGEHYFPGTKVYSDSRLGLDSRQAKDIGINEGDFVELVVPEISLQIPEVKVKSQHRLRIPPELREKYGIEPGDAYDVFITEDTDTDDAGGGDGA